METWQPILRLFATELIPHPFSVWWLFRKGWRHLHKLRGTVASELKQLISGPATRAAMSGVLLYTGLPPERTPVFQMLALIAMFDEGFYLPEGGMGAIPNALSDAVRKHGGTIFTGAKVEKIKATNGRVSGLDVQGYGVVRVDAVISTVSGMLTVGSLLGAENVPESMRRKAKNAPLSHKAVSLQL